MSDVDRSIPDRNLALELVRVTESAATFAARWIGRGDKIAADQAAVDAMRLMLDTVSMRGVVVIGEGEKDEAPMLFNGEAVGDGTGPEVDVAVDPLEGTRLTALGMPNAISVIAVAERGALFFPGAALYMDKIAVGPEAADAIDIDATPTENLERVAEAKHVDVNDLTVVVLERERHDDLIAELREAGARVNLIRDGDVAPAIAAAQVGTGVDLLMGVGGTPEGVISAAAIKCLGGAMQGKLWPRNDDERAPRRGRLRHRPRADDRRPRPGRGRLRRRDRGHERRAHARGTCRRRPRRDRVGGDALPLGHRPAHHRDAPPVQDPEPDERSALMASNELRETARAIVADHKGILAADESTGTIKKRLDSIQVESTEENRRFYRQLLFTAPGIEDSIGGVILYDETIRQAADDGTPLAEVLASKGVIPGIKVDTGAHDHANFPGEKVTEGLDGLRARLEEYRGLGARFAKWRAVITIGDGIPTDGNIQANAHALARYAALCQEAGIAPIVEPEVLMDADNTLEVCWEVTTRTLHETFDALYEAGIDLQGALLAEHGHSRQGLLGPVQPGEDRGGDRRVLPRDGAGGDPRHRVPVRWPVGGPGDGEPERDQPDRRALGSLLLLRPCAPGLGARGVGGRSRERGSGAGGVQSPRPHELARRRRGVECGDGATGHGVELRVRAAVACTGRRKSSTRRGNCSGDEPPDPCDDEPHEHPTRQHRRRPDPDHRRARNLAGYPTLTSFPPATLGS